MNGRVMTQMMWTNLFCCVVVACHGGVNGIGNTLNYPSFHASCHLILLYALLKPCVNKAEYSKIYS